jgi:hypothetical protein
MKTDLSNSAISGTHDDRNRDEAHEDGSFISAIGATHDAGYTDGMDESSPVRRRLTLSKAGKHYSTGFFWMIIPGYSGFIHANS